MELTKSVLNTLGLTMRGNCLITLAKEEKLQEFQKGKFQQKTPNTFKVREESKLPQPPSEVNRQAAATGGNLQELQQEVLQELQLQQGLQ
jgi:hypothetical protein